MTRYSRKKGQNVAHKPRINKTKNYKYLNEEKVAASKGDEDLPGHGNFHCDTCCRHFMSQEVLDEHVRKSKEHKREVKRQRKEKAEEERMAALMPSTKRKRPNDFEMDIDSGSSTKKLRE